MHTIRPFSPDDYPAITAVRNAAFPNDPVTVEEIRGWDRIASTEAGHIFHRLVAADATGQVVGYAFTRHTSRMPDGQWAVSVVVHPQARHQGAGGRLYEATGQWLAGHGPRVLESHCRAADTESYAWAQRRGFAQWREGTESILDLTQWQPERFAAHLERVRNSGITLVTYGDARKIDDPALLRSMYEAEAGSAPDIPSFEGSFTDYSAWEHWLRNDPATWFTALALDQGRVAGLSYLKLPPPPMLEAYTGFTGVRREYRGRGIALAIKVLTAEAARAHGCRSMRTNNDPDNPPMLRVNEKLGYRRVPGWRLLKKRLTAEETEG